MQITNTDLQDHLHQIADLLDLSGANSFRIRAYRQAAHTIGTFTENAAVAILNGTIKELPGIGDTISKCLYDQVTTGQCTQLEALHQKIPAGLLGLLQITGLGPKRIKKLYETLKIDSLASLEAACINQQIEKVPGFGVKTQKNILEEIALLGVTNKARAWSEVAPIADKLVAFLQKIPNTTRITIAGSFRRKKPIVKDIDVIIATTDGKQVGEQVITYPEAGKVLAHGDTKVSMRIDLGIQTDIRMVHPDSYACALAYFTGSKDFNVALRLRALDRGFTLNEYTLRPLDGSPPQTFADEAELHAALGLEYIPPEQRETAAEIHRQT